MATPLLVSFDRYACLTFGLDAVTAGGAIVVNGVAQVTGWLSNAQWSVCYSQGSTSWTDCASAPVTNWTDCYSDPSTTWSACS